LHLRTQTCKNQSVVVLEQDWIDEKVISDGIIESSRQNLC